MTDAKPTVFVVDDDLSVRNSLALLIESAGWQPEMFGSAQEFLARPRHPDPAACCSMSSCPTSMVATSSSCSPIEPKCRSS